MSYPYPHGSSHARSHSNLHSCVFRPVTSEFSANCSHFCNVTHRERFRLPNWNQTPLPKSLLVLPNKPNCHIIECLNSIINSLNWLYYPTRPFKHSQLSLESWISADDEWSTMHEFRRLFMSALWRRWTQFDGRWRLQSNRLETQSCPGILAFYTWLKTASSFSREGQKAWDFRGMLKVFSGLTYIDDLHFWCPD